MWPTTQDRFFPENTVVDITKIDGATLCFDLFGKHYRFHLSNTELDRLAVEDLGESEAREWAMEIIASELTNCQIIPQRNQ